MFVFIFFGVWKYFLKEYVVIGIPQNSPAIALLNSDAIQILTKGGRDS